MSRSTQRITDELLVLAAQEGRETAFAALYDRWHRSLLAQAYRATRDAEAAQDVAQEAWLGIARGLRRLDDPRRFPAWCVSIVLHKAQDWVRRQSRSRQLQADYAQERQDLAEGSDERSHQDDSDEVQQVLRSLAREKREVLRLFYLDELGIQEIAEVLDVPPGTVKSRLYHARKEFKEALERRSS